jgi:polyhydroxyalkanoate synthesis regulator phasin
MLNSLYNKTMEVTDQWVKAGTVENRFEGDRISQALQEAGIPFLIKSFLDTAYNGLYIPQKGWGTVMVPGKNGEEAKKLISDIKKTFLKEGEDETGQPG